MRVRAPRTRVSAPGTSLEMKTPVSPPQSECNPVGALQVGSGTSKKLAKRNAAAKMLVRIHNVPMEPREGSEAEVEEDQFSMAGPRLEGLRGRAPGCTWDSLRNSAGEKIVQLRSHPLAPLGAGARALLPEDTPPAGVVRAKMLVYMQTLYRNSFTNMRDGSGGLLQDLNQKCQLLRPEVTLITQDEVTLKMSDRNQKSARAQQRAKTIKPKKHLCQCGREV
nr:PREDICTED: RISC-loading complex subunit TARBP2 [Struthio camelus australis]